LLKNLEEASEKLLKKISDEVDESWLIVSISKNGLKISNYLSEKLGIEKKCLFIETVYCQNNADCEIAFVDEFKNIKMNEYVKTLLEIKKKKVLKAIDVIYEYKLIPKAEEFRGNRDTFKIGEKQSKVLIVDASLEQGYRMELAISTMESFGIDDIYIAVPFIPTHIFDIFESKVENIFHLEKIDFYTDISDYFEDFEKQIPEQDTFLFD
jgi:predicted phosphoribosyltransferase